MTIALAQYRFRKRYIQGGGKVEDLKFAVPFFPLVPILCILMCLFIFGFTFYDPTQRSSFLIGVAFVVACYLYYHFWHSKRKVQPQPVDADQEAPPSAI